MELKSFEFNPFGERTYVVYDLESRQAAIVDPGMMSETEKMDIESFVQANSLKVKYLINTHLHIDHVAGNEFVENRYDVGLSANYADAFLGERLAQQAEMFHLNPSVAGCANISHRLKDGEVIHLGKEPIEIIYVPGHSPGSIALYSPVGKFVLTGDALFRGSIGRTDLPGGDYATLIRSIRERLFTLPDNTVVYPGHGPKTTIAIEKQMNPYV